MWHAKNQDTKEEITAFDIAEILDRTENWEVTVIWYIKQS